MRKVLALVFLCIIGILVNFLFNYLGPIMLHLPLFLDTVGTIAVTLIAGPVLGSIAGSLTTFIGDTINYSNWDPWGPDGYLFALCHIATALVTWLFMRLFPKELSLAGNPKQLSNSGRLNAVMNRMVILILLSFALCIVISILGGLISYFIGVIRSSSGEAANPAAVQSIFYVEMFHAETPPVLREILSRIPINIIDRLISAFAGFGIAWCLARLPLKQAAAA
jgi:hypothetical protein